MAHNKLVEVPLRARQGPVQEHFVSSGSQHRQDGQSQSETLCRHAASAAANVRTKLSHQMEILTIFKCKNFATLNAFGSSFATLSPSFFFSPMLYILASSFSKSCPLAKLDIIWFSCSSTKNIPDHPMLHFALLWDNLSRQCSVTCGRGWKNRTVQCLRGKEVIPDANCSALGLKKPKSGRGCQGSCLAWLETDWGAVSPVGCDLGQSAFSYTVDSFHVIGIIQVYSVHWLRKKKYPRRSFCHTHRVLLTECKDVWRLALWASSVTVFRPFCLWLQCSSGCGDGLQRRRVLCIDNSNPRRGALVRSARKCRNLPNKPSTLRRCYGQATCAPDWHTDVFGEVSKLSHASFSFYFFPAKLKTTWFFFFEIL